MLRGEKSIRIVFTGGGTGGHIYPGIAVADELFSLAKDKNLNIEIHWIGSSTGMDRGIIEKNLVSCGGSIFKFHGIPCGKLRRYLSFQNFIDLFKIAAGFFSAFFLLLKLKPEVVFSKGGFVSVPPCAVSRLLKIPYFTHECDFTPGLATRLNSKGASKIFVSYGQTIDFFKTSLKSKCVVTGNPVRPVFYKDSSKDGKEFLKIPADNKKPVLFISGGSLGARQINCLVQENLEWMKEKFIVVHQTGKAFAAENPELMNSGDENYKPFEFIYSEMPSVIQASDVLLSRAGANSLWEAAVCKKPMLLIPLCGSGTRGDQVDNARFFENQKGALVLCRNDVNSDNLKKMLCKLEDVEIRKALSEACSSILPEEKPAYKIANIILEGVES